MRAERESSRLGALQSLSGGTRRRMECQRRKTRTRQASVPWLSRIDGQAERFTCEHSRLVVTAHPWASSSNREFPLHRDRAPLTEGILRGPAEVPTIVGVAIDGVNPRIATAAVGQPAMWRAAA